MSSWASYAGTDHAKSHLTSYWENHRAHISLERIGEDAVRVTGQSGFYFPGNSYSGLDTLNACFAFLRFFSPIYWSTIQL